MKLVELLRNQELKIQIVWNEQKIEFTSRVIDKDESSVFVTPYILNGSELDLNIVSDNNVVCNIFTSDPTTEQRISWKGLSLSTVTRDQKKVYCLMTHRFNEVSCLDDRRLHERVVIQVDGSLLDSEAEDISITIHDISDNGIAFYIAGNYEPKTQQLRISFSDSIDGRTYDIKAVCGIARMNKEEERTLVGCRVLEENDNYRTYEFLMRLRKKNHIVSKKVEIGSEIENESESTEVEEKAEPVVA